MKAIIMLTPPRIQHADGTESVWFGRIDKAISLAKQFDCPLIICGDGTPDQSDLDTFVARAEQAGVERIVRAWNEGDQHTRGDMRAAARALHTLPDLQAVEELHIVTCWYHQIRSIAALHVEVRGIRVHRRLRFIPAPVWANWLEGVKRLTNLRRGELRGTWDYLQERPQTSRMDSRVSSTVHSS